MLIILVKEKQVWINKIQMRVTLIDFESTGWAKLGGAEDNAM